MGRTPVADGYLAPPRPRVLAHRGLALDAPENTLLAFQRAVDAGAEYIETDVHVSADGIAIVSHDPDLARVAGRPGRVGDLTRDELHRIELGFDQGFCSLAEALDAFPQTRFNIDVKILPAAPAAATAIRAAGAEARVLVSSFDERTRQAALALLPGVVSSASSRRFAPALFGGKLGLQPIVRRSLEGLVAVQIPERAVGLTIVTPRMVKRLHAAGVEIHVWTINDPADMRRLLALGVDGIVTDRCDLALEVVRQHAAAAR